MRKLISLALAGHAAPALLAAQKGAAKGVATVDPGMTREQVVAALGEPFSSRSREEFTYLLYKNGCEKICGMDDLVVLDSGKVVDAVFRSPGRRYTGTSSSPHMISAEEAAGKAGDSTAHTARAKNGSKATITPKPAAKSALKVAPPVVSKSATPTSTPRPGAKPQAKPDSAKARPNPAVKKPGD